MYGRNSQCFSRIPLTLVNIIIRIPFHVNGFLVLVQTSQLSQFSSVTQSCPTLCDPMDCSMPGFPVHHQLPEFTQTNVHRVGDAIQPFHPLSSPPPAFSLSQYLGLFKWVNSSQQVAKVLEFQLQYQSFQWIFITNFLRIDSCNLFAVQGTLKSLLQHYISKASILRQVPNN